MEHRIVIIGGGPAGYEAALTGALYGADVTLVEEQGPGGNSVSTRSSTPGKASSSAPRMVARSTAPTP